MRKPAGHHVFEVTFHEIIAEHTLQDFTVSPEHSSFAGSFVILELTLVHFVLLGVVELTVANLLAIVHMSHVVVARLRVERSTIGAAQLVLLPSTLLEAAAVKDQLADAVLRHLPQLAVIDVSVGVQQHTNWSRLALSKLTLIDDHGRHHHELFVVAVEFVILERTFVDEPIGHDHASAHSLIVAPEAVKDRAICPDHLSMSIALARSPVTSVLSLLELHSSLTRWQRVLVEHLTVAVRATILKVADEFVAVLEIDAAPVLEAAVDQTTGVSTLILNTLLDLEVILSSVFDRDVSVGAIINELTFVLRHITEDHSAMSADAPVLLPLAVVQVAVRVVAFTLGAVAAMVQVATLVVLAIAEQDLDMVAIRDGALLEAALNDLVVTRVQNTSAVWRILSPFTFVESTGCEHAATSARALIVLEVTAINVAVAHPQHALTIPLVL